MGNRAVIACNSRKMDIGIYVHWNGGPESVLAFLEAARQFGVRSPAEDEPYYLARLTQIIANFMGGTTSVGLGRLQCSDCDNGDNGLYIVGPDGKLKDRKYVPEHERVRPFDEKYYEAVLADTLKANRRFFKGE